MAGTMSKSELKVLLQNFHDMQVQIEYVKKKMKEGTSVSEKIKELETTVLLLEAALKILNDKEWFIIEYHLILKYTWPETVLKMSSHFGINNSRSERTLKRIQNQALEKMLRFIEKLDEY